MADAMDSKSIARKGVWVRLPLLPLWGVRLMVKTPVLLTGDGCSTHSRPIF